MYNGVIDYKAEYMIMGTSHKKVNSRMPTPGDTTTGDWHLRKMKTNKHEQFDRQIRQIQRSLDQQDLRLQNCLRANENMRQRLAAITDSADLKNIILPSIAPKQIAIANGKLLPPEQIQDQNRNIAVALNGNLSESKPHTEFKE